MEHEKDCSSTQTIDCYYYDVQRCRNKAVPHCYCVMPSLPGDCTFKRPDLAHAQWKEKYWHLMAALREKASK